MSLSPGNDETKITRTADARIGEDNACAHKERKIMGREVVVAVTDGRLDFCT